MDKHSFHITYTQATEHSVKLAIDNVLVNFFNFLKFNKFTPKNLNIKIGIEKDCHFQLSKTFINNLLSKEFHHEKWFEHSPRIEENGEPDFLGSCFYMINCLQ